MLDRIRNAERFEGFSRAVEWPVGLLALLVIPAILIGDYAPDPAVREAAIAANWVIWGMFCVEYLAKLALAPDRPAFIRSAWFDLALIALSPPVAVPETMQGARSLRALRLLRLLRAGFVLTLVVRRTRQALYQRDAHYVAVLAVFIISVGALSAFLFEHGANREMSTVSDAFWWAIVTATTVGYGDVSPVTPAGRLIAVVLMVVGLGLVGVLTGMLASFLVHHEQQLDLSQIDERLQRIEALLARQAGLEPFERARCTRATRRIERELTAPPPAA